MPANNFYRDIASFYNRFFPLSGKKVTFFENRLRQQGAASVLDLACGSGELSRALAAEGFAVTGVDGASEFFDTDLRSGTAADDAMLCAALMEELPFSNEELFDAVICAGNSLPHLDDWRRIETAVSHCARIVRAGGLFCIQAIDFSIIRAKGIVTLPELRFTEGSGETQICLKRCYRVDDEGAAFTPELKIGNVFAHYRIPMYPLEYDLLWDLLRECGFSHAGTFSDFAESPWERKTPSYITLARKTG